MRVYEVTNGYVGNSYTRVYVIAENEDRAKEIAKERYKKVAKENDYRNDYFENLKEECICEDTTKEWCSEMYDD